MAAQRQEWPRTKGHGTARHVSGPQHVSCQTAFDGKATGGVVCYGTLNAAAAGDPIPKEVMSTVRMADDKEKRDAPTATGGPVIVEIWLGVPRLAHRDARILWADRQRPSDRGSQSCRASRSGCLCSRPAPPTSVGGVGGSSAMSCASARLVVRLDPQ